jgi:hypothetical protein
LTACRARAITLDVFDWDANAFFVEDDISVVVVVVVVSTACFLAIFAIAPVFWAA